MPFCPSAFLPFHPFHHAIERVTRRSVELTARRTNACVRDCAAAGAVTKGTAEHAKIAEPKNLSALCGLCGCSIAISPIIMLKLFHKCGKVSYSR